MNPYLNDDLMTLAESVRRFAEERVAPGFLERDQTRVLERGLMREMGELGFIAPELLGWVALAAVVGVMLAGGV